LVSFWRQFIISGTGEASRSPPGEAPARPKPLNKAIFRQNDGITTKYMVIMTAI
jgi:hypothetical protein